MRVDGYIIVACDSGERIILLDREYGHHLCDGDTYSSSLKNGILSFSAADGTPLEIPEIGAEDVSAILEGGGIGICEISQGRISKGCYARIVKTTK